MEPELPILGRNWDALSSDEAGAAATELGVSPFWKTVTGVASPEYTQAYNALMTITGNFLWSVSGAQAPPDEVARRVEVLLPLPNESEASRQQKLDRVKYMVESVRTNTAYGMDPDAIVSGGGGGVGGDISAGDGITFRRK